MLNPIKRWKAGVEQRSFKRRVRSYKKGLKIVAKYDGMVVSKSVYHQALALLGVYASLVEKAGGISNALRKGMLQDLTVITQGFVDSAFLGDPNVQMPEIRDTYVNARRRSQSRKARQRAALGQAVRQLTNATGKAPAVRDVRLIKRNIKQDRSI